MPKLAFSMILIAGAAACGSTTNNTNDAPTMIQRGAALFAEECAHCHGDAGQGSDKGPKVVGDGALPFAPAAGSKRDVNFRTALDVFQWVKKTMPGDDPGSLRDDEYLAIMAFDLAANGVKLDEPLDAESAAQIVINDAP